MASTLLTIATTWQGKVLAMAQQAVVTVFDSDGALVVEVDAPFNGDPPPRAAASDSVAAVGRTERLWEHEVVEVFFAEAARRDARYLELELGPQGHWLALGFVGYRQLRVDDLTVSFEAHIEAGRWRGRAQLHAAEVARAVARVGAMNAYAIRGRGAERTYMAAWPTPAGLHAGPDFHRIETFR